VQASRRATNRAATTTPPTTGCCSSIGHRGSAGRAYWTNENWRRTAVGSGMTRPAHDVGHDSANDSGHDCAHDAGHSVHDSAQPQARAVRRILVVDDDDLILEVAQMSLELVGGWTVTTASGGQEAVRKATVEQPDAIVMDVMMPGMDGPTASRALRDNPATSEIPIVLLTAKVQASDRAALHGLPVVGVLAKPFDPMALPTELATMLGWS
jgi:CheY-like chemotaxis protein